MLIIQEDPGKVKSVKELQLQNSKVRSWTASQVHKRRRAPFPCIRVPRQLTRQSRCFAFYRQRISGRWAGWKDHQFWTSLAPCIASTHVQVMQGLFAISSYLESLDTNDEQLRTLSIRQGTTAITWLNGNHLSLTRTVLLTQCIILTAFSALLNDLIYNQALSAQWALVDNLEDDEYGLLTLMKMQRSQYCQILDPLPLLRSATIHDSTPEIKGFHTLSKAREYLEVILYKLAFQAKASIPLNYHLLEKWTENFHQIRAEVNESLWMCLHAACGMSVIQIETMFTETETVYDQYMEVFRDVADVVDSLSIQEKPLRMLAGLDGGLLNMAGWAAKWCRDPALRRRLISGLRNARMMEAIQASGVTATRCTTIMRIEEENIHPSPTCCSDIPESSRVRIHGFACKMGTSFLFRMDFLRAPYYGPVESVWVVDENIPGADIQFHCADRLEGFEEELDYYLGPACFTSRTPSGSAFTLKALEFHFLIPRVF